MTIKITLNLSNTNYYSYRINILDSKNSNTIEIKNTTQTLEIGYGSTISISITPLSYKYLKIFTRYYKVTMTYNDVNNSNSSSLNFNYYNEPTAKIIENEIFGNITINISAKK